MRPDIPPDDRLGLTVCVAGIDHAVLILGVSFGSTSPPGTLYESLEIILMPERTEQIIDDVEMLSQTNLQGGGGEGQDAPLLIPLVKPLQLAKPPDATIESTPPTIIAPVPRTKPERSAEFFPHALNTPGQHRSPENGEEFVRSEPQEKKLPPTSPVERTEPTLSQPEKSKPLLPTATQLLTRSFALASLNAELQQRLETGTKRPRRKYISANTREYLYAAYMEAWRAKVERVGNINYPDEARQRQLSGTLLLDVALAPDGSVKEITVRRSSGHRVLDDAAARIVRLAAPFAPFPPDIRKDVDILHVTRTWKFLNNKQFSGL